MGPAHRSRFRSRAFLRSAIVLRGHGTGHGDAVVLWAIALSSLPECGDSDISLPSLKSALERGREGPRQRHRGHHGLVIVLQIRSSGTPRAFISLT
jgi:hypothetical protein